MSKFSENLIDEALRNTDNRIKNGLSVTPGFLIAALLWPSLLKKCVKNNEINIRIFFRSMDNILKNQQQLTAIPRKFHSYIKDKQRLYMFRHELMIEQHQKALHDIYNHT